MTQALAKLRARFGRSGDRDTPRETITDPIEIEVV